MNPSWPSSASQPITWYQSDVRDGDDRLFTYGQRPVNVHNAYPSPRLPGGNGVEQDHGAVRLSRR